MKTKSLLFCMLCFGYAYAGTPSITDTSILYGIALILLGLLIGVPYLIKFVKRKRNAMIHKNEENEVSEPVIPEE